MNIPTRTRVDRELELDFLMRMARHETDKRILLMQAQSGIGKSELLREFELRCAKVKDVSLVMVDFKGGGFHLAELFRHTCQVLGGSKRFPKFAAHVTELAQVNITHNWMVGSNTINVALTLNAPDEETRSQRRTALTEGLFADLQGLGHIVFAFDTFEQSDELLQGWLTSAFLSQVRYTAHVSAVIAGQRIPPQNNIWHSICREHVLPPIPPKDWHHYSQSLGLPLSVEQIERCCHGHQGLSAKIAETLHYFAPQEYSL